MGFNELSIIDGPCDDAPCAELPPCAVYCDVLEGAVVAPPSLSVVVASNSATPATEQSFTDYGSFFEPDGWFLDDDDCLQSKPLVLNALGSLEDLHDDAIVAVIDSVPLDLRLVSAETSGELCCVFVYESPILSSSPAIILNDDGEPLESTLADYLESNLFTRRWQSLGAHPGGTTTWPAPAFCGTLAGDTGPCAFFEYAPAATVGWHGIYVNARVEITVCKSTCDGSWYGTIEIGPINYIVHRTDLLEVPNFATDGAGVIHDIAAETYYFHVPNTGTGTNASGSMTNGDKSFTLTMADDDPCPPNETTKQPARLMFYVDDTSGSPVQVPSYAHHYGNFPGLVVRALNNATPSVSEITYYEWVPGQFAWVLTVFLPITADVTEIDDALDLIHADPRFVVSDRVNTDSAFGAGSSPFYPEYKFGEGDMTGGTNTTPVDPADVFDEILAQFSTAQDFTTGPWGDYDYSTPFHTWWSPTPSQVGTCLDGSDEAPCSGPERGCGNSGYNYFLDERNAVVHWWALDEITWRFDV